jgi:short-subunit dehydrogenase
LSPGLPAAGVDCAHELARRGVNLILVARWTDVLERVAKELRDHYGIEVCVAPADLSDGSVREPSYSELELAGRHVDLLANNADSPCLAHLLKSNWARVDQMLQVVCLSLPPSLSSLLPPYASYGAAKSYVLSLDCGTQSRTTGYRRELYCGLSRSHSDW